MFWLIGFSILRYAIALEAISGIIIWTAIGPIFRGKSELLALGIVCVASIAVTKPLGWGRIGYSRALVEPPVPFVDCRSLVFLSGGPLGFVLPYLNSQGNWFVSLDWLSGVSAEVSVVKRLTKTASGIRLITDAPENHDNVAKIDAQLARFGLLYDEESCLPIPSPVQKTLRICVVRASG